MPGALERPAAAPTGAPPGRDRAARNWGSPRVADARPGARPAARHYARPRAACALRSSPSASTPAPVTHDVSTTETSRSWTSPSRRPSAATSWLVAPPASRLLQTTTSGHDVPSCP